MIYITPLQWSFPLPECMEFHHRPRWSCSPRSAPLLVKYSTWNSAWNLCAVICSLLYSYFIWNYISKIDLDILSCLFIIPHSLVKLNNSLSSFAQRRIYTVLAVFVADFSFYSITINDTMAWIQSFDHFINFDLQLNAGVCFFFAKMYWWDAPKLIQQLFLWRNKTCIYLRENVEWAQV